MVNVWDPKIIEDILQNTLNALESSKHQMFEIVEAARVEYDRILLALKELKEDIHETIAEVERLEIEFRKTRQLLAEVNKNYTLYSDEEKVRVYKRAEQIREELAIVRERERNLHKRRFEQEQSLMRISKLVEKAEETVAQVGVALDYLCGNIAEINTHLENIQIRTQLRQKIIKVQEDERKRVAREIHDGPAQSLANVVLKAEICERLFHAGRNQDLMRELAELKQAVSESLREVRQIIYNLRPMVLDDLGLVPAIKRLIKELEEEENLSVDIIVIGEETRLDNTIEVAVFRVVQEAITNSLKHARANNLEIKIEFLPDRISAAIEDNGIGFDLDSVNQQLAKGEHFGLYGMRERMDLLGGTLKITSAVGKGTRIGITIPLLEV